MLNNTITLQIDETAQNTTKTATDISCMTRVSEDTGRSIYLFPAHSDVKRETLGFYRAMPKRSGDFLGQRKSSAKLTLDVSVPTATASVVKTAPSLFEVSGSIPVGTSEVDFLKFLGRLQAVVNDVDLMTEVFRNSAC